MARVADLFLIERRADVEFHSILAIMTSVWSSIVGGLRLSRAWTQGSGPDRVTSNRKKTQAVSGGVGGRLPFGILQTSCLMRRVEKYMTALFISHSRLTLESMMT